MTTQSQKRARSIIAEHKEIVAMFLEKTEEILEMPEEADSLPTAQLPLIPSKDHGLVIEDISCAVCKTSLVRGAKRPPINVEDSGVFVCSSRCEEIVTAAGG